MAEIENNVSDIELAQPEIVATETPELEAPEAEAPKEVEFPKKAVNAISHRDRKIGKLQAQLNAERSAREALEKRNSAPATQTNAQGVPAKLPTGEPNPDYYTNYDDLTQARIDYVADKKVGALTKAQEETQRTQQQQAYVSQLESTVAAKAQSFIKENPEAQAIIEEYADIADEFPEHVQMAFLEADNAPLAFYNLAKEGKLESLITMSPSRAAMEIGRAQAQAFVKTVTKAPSPMSTAKGTATTKSVENMNSKDLLKWINS